MSFAWRRSRPRLPPPRRGTHPSIKEQHCSGTSQRSPPRSRLAIGEWASRLALIRADRRWVSALFSRRSEGRLQQPRNHNTHRDLPPFPCDDSAGTSLLLVPPQRCHRLQHLSWPSTKHSTLEEPPPHRNLRIASGPAFIYFYLPSPFRLFAVPSLAVGSTAVGSRRHSTRAHTRASSCRLRRGARKPRHPALFSQCTPILISLWF